ncbi:hypothetical protein HK097_005866, partial [Rhizophlyctis rosea]
MNNIHTVSLLSKQYTSSTLLGAYKDGSTILEANVNVAEAPERVSVDGEREVALKPLRSSREVGGNSLRVEGGDEAKGRDKRKGTEEEGVHYVKEGDTLARIAIMYGVKIADLRRINKLYSDTEIWSRSKLFIPSESPDSPTSPTTFLPNPIPTTQSPLRPPNPLRTPSLDLIDLNPGPTNPPKNRTIYPPPPPPRTQTTTDFFRDIDADLETIGGLHPRGRARGGDPILFTFTGQEHGGSVRRGVVRVGEWAPREEGGSGTIGNGGGAVIDWVYSTITAIATHAGQYVPSFSSISIRGNYNPVATSTQPDDSRGAPTATDPDAMLDMVVRLFGGKRKCGRWGNGQKDDSTGTGLQQRTHVGSPIQLVTVKEETEQEAEMAGRDGGG